MAIKNVSKVDIENNKKLSEAAIDSNETMLLTNISNAHVDTGLTKDFICGIDCGSTQTRIVLLPRKLTECEDVDNWFDINAVIPAKSKLIPKDCILKSHSNKLFDNLDSLFTLNAEPEIRLIRGSKFNDVDVAEKELVASSKKVTSSVLKYNIIDAIGYGLVQYYAKIQESIPGSISCSIAIALPPDDLLEKDIKKLKSSFNRFTWTMPGKLDHPIEVKIVDIDAYAEPEAQVKAYYVFSEEDTPEEVLLLETGGRNSAPVILLNGIVVGNGLKSIEQSGSKLLDKIGLAYINEYGGKMPSLRHLEQAVRTGNIKAGNSYIDISELIKRCKDEVAEDLFQKLLSDVLSKQTVVSLETLNTVLLSGRVYKRGDYNYSVADKVKDLIKEISPYTEVNVIDENLIPQGLIFMYLLDKVYNDM